MRHYLYLILFLLVTISCKREKASEFIHGVKKNEYAQNFHINSEAEGILIHSANKITHFPKGFKINRCIITNTSSSAYIDILGEFNTIVGVSSPNYFYNSKISEGIKSGSILDIGNDATLNYEKIIKLKPDIIITSQNANHEKILNQLDKQGIKVLYVEEFNEQHPLGKMEYLKLFGYLFNQNARADSIYNNIKKNYYELKNKTQNISYRPTVFTNIMYGDSWYMAGGKSFIAQIFRDAGGKYLWEDVAKTGTIPLSFEEVFIKAKNANYWIGASNFKDKREIESSNLYYKQFKAYKNNDVYAFNNKENFNLANDYYEMGNIYADKILADVIKVLHPELLPNYSLTYLKKIE